MWTNRYWSTHDGRCSSKLTPLGVIVLALLREGDMHPYEMIRLLRQRRDDRLVTIPNGTFYHTVARLEPAGLLAEVGVDRDGNRPERTTYALTAEGSTSSRSGCAASCRASTGRPQFRVALAEAHNLRATRSIDLLAAPAGAHRRRSGRSPRRARAYAGQRACPPSSSSTSNATKRILAADLAWLDDLLRRLTSREIPWGWSEIPPDTLERLRAHREALTT